MSIPDEIIDNVFVAGATLKDGKLLTSGGRVLGVTAVEKDLKTAVEHAYEMAEKVEFENRYFRRDIGARALKAL